MNKIKETLLKYLLSEKIKTEHINATIKLVCEELEQNSDYFTSVRIRPKKTEQTICIEKESKFSEQYAIVVQGPLVENNDFTYETIKLYNQNFPNVTVILSTWKNSSENYLLKIKNDLKCEIVLSDEPVFNGLFNGNFQIVSTLAGIECAKSLGKKYVFKTRTDYRFYKKGILDFMRDLIIKFPADDSRIKQNYRIIIADSRNNDMYRPFFVGDQFGFGEINDMYNYWNMDLVEDRIIYSDYVKQIQQEHWTWKKEREYVSYFIVNYIERMTGTKPEINVESYWRFVKESVIPMSLKDLDAFWYKYDFRFLENEAWGLYYPIDTNDICLEYNWDFSRWFNLYNNNLVYELDCERISEINRW